jgi:hypothetical protein
LHDIKLPAAGNSSCTRIWECQTSQSNKQCHHSLGRQASLQQQQQQQHASCKVGKTVIVLIT